MKKADLERVEKFIRPYRVTKGKDFRLKEHDPADTGRSTSADKKTTRRKLERGHRVDGRAAGHALRAGPLGLLLVFQAMDAAGKDSAIKHVTSGINPQGCSVRAFKQPSSEELDHDFLWRYHEHVPARGQIGIFNRSYYEDVLVVRVHDELLKAQKIPPQRIGKKIGTEPTKTSATSRATSTATGSSWSSSSSTCPGRAEAPLHRALDEPEKNWKFAAGDVDERQHWRDYMKAYEDAIRETATPESPWYVVPADNKWSAAWSSPVRWSIRSRNLGSSIQWSTMRNAKRSPCARKRLERERADSAASSRAARPLLRGEPDQSCGDVPQLPCVLVVARGEVRLVGLQSDSSRRAALDLGCS